MPTSSPALVDAATLRGWLDEGRPVRLLDVRTPGEFATAHIEGSVNLPVDRVRSDASLLRDQVGDDLVVVCQSGQRARQAAEALGAGPGGAPRVLEGGLGAWTAADAPVERGEGAWAMERQVRMVAGSLVLAGVLGSLALPRAKWLAGGIGAGLTFSAATNTCAMAQVLGVMPWNRPGPAPDVDEVKQRLGEVSAA